MRVFARRESFGDGCHVIVNLRWRQLQDKGWFSSLVEPMDEGGASKIFRWTFLEQTILTENRQWLLYETRIRGDIDA